MKKKSIPIIVLAVVLSVFFLGVVVLGVLDSVPFFGKQDPHASIPKGRILRDIGDVPFLIPATYFRSARARNGSASELSLHASLPGVDDDGAEADQKVGWENYLMIGAFPPALYTEMGKSELYTERISLNNLRALLSSARRGNITLRGIDFMKKWSDFLEANKFRDREILDASDIFGWATSGHPPSERQSDYFVAFENGRIVLFSSCTLYVEGTSPSCWANYHTPDDRFALRLIFSRDYLEQTLSIAKTTRNKLVKFNRAARRFLNRGASFNSGENNE